MNVRKIVTTSLQVMQFTAATISFIKKENVVEAVKDGVAHFKAGTMNFKHIITSAENIWKRR